MSLSEYQYYECIEGECADHMTHSSPSVNRITRSSILTNTPRDDVIRGVDSNVVESCNSMVMRRVLPDSSERTCDLKYWLYDENNTTTPFVKVHSRMT